MTVCVGWLWPSRHAPPCLAQATRWEVQCSDCLSSTVDTITELFPMDKHPLTRTDEIVELTVEVGAGVQQRAATRTTSRRHLFACARADPG